MTLFENLAYAVQAGATPGRDETATSWRWATVTQVEPLRIRFDGEETELDATPDVITSGLFVGARVWVQQYGRRLIVHGTSSQPIVQAGAVTVTASGGIGTAPVVFPVPFPGTPVITVSGQSGVAALSNVQFAAPSATGFTMVMQRSTSTETTCTWLAVWSPTSTP